MAPHPPETPGQGECWDQRPMVIGSLNVASAAAIGVSLSLPTGSALGRELLPVCTAVLKTRQGAPVPSSLSSWAARDTGAAPTHVPGARDLHSSRIPAGWEAGLTARGWLGRAVALTAALPQL